MVIVGRIFLIIMRCKFKLWPSNLLYNLPFICESLGCMQLIIRFTVGYENVMFFNLSFWLALLVKRFCSMGRIGAIFILIVVTLATASSKQASCSKPSSFVATEGKNEAFLVTNKRLRLVHLPLPRIHFNFSRRHTHNTLLAN